MGLYRKSGQPDGYIVEEFNNGVEARGTYFSTKREGGWYYKKDNTIYKTGAYRLDKKYGLWSFYTNYVVGCISKMYISVDNNMDCYMLEFFIGDKTKVHSEEIL